METLIVYLLKAALSLGVLYAFFRLFLNGETFHRLNRFVLIGVLIVCWVLPLVESRTEEPNVVQQTWIEVETSVVQMPELLIVEPTEVGRMWLFSDLLLGLYLLGFGWRLTILLISWLRIRHIFRRGYTLERAGCRVVVGDNSIDSFSFGRTVYMQSDDYSNHFESVLAHEQAHISNCHTLDLLLVEVVIALQWFNPAAYLLKKRMVDLHEYEADRSVINQGIDAKTYQRLLVRKSIVRSHILFANSLNQSFIKKRIAMMLKKKSSFWASLKLVGVIPTALVCVSLFAKPIEETVKTVNEQIEVDHSIGNVINQREAKNDVSVVTAYATKAATPTEKVTPAEQSATPTEQEVKTAQGDEPTYTTAEVMPIFPGGPKALMSFLNENIKYPTEALKDGIQGRVICSFVVRKDGSIADAKVNRSVSPTLDAEALRVINSMPKWIPGKQRGTPINVLYHIPILFALQEAKKQQPATPTEQEVKTAQGDEPTYTTAEVMPIFPGGQKALMSFLNENIKYPTEALKDGIQGRVICSFVVRKDGSIADAKVNRSVSPTLDAEALRVINSMPKWIPGKQRGTPINVLYHIPILFALQEAKKQIAH